MFKLKQFLSKLKLQLFQTHLSQPWYKDAAVPDQDYSQHPGARGPAGEQADYPP